MAVGEAAVHGGLVNACQREQSADKSDPAQNALARRADEWVGKHDDESEKAEMNLGRDSVEVGVLFAGKKHQRCTRLSGTAAISGRGAIAFMETTLFAGRADGGATRR